MSNAVPPDTSRRSEPHALRPRAARACLLLVVLVVAMVPWYSLRLLPLVTIGTAKVNILDGLAAAAVCFGLPDVVRGLRAGPRALWWVCAFLAAMPVPLLTGLRDPRAAFLAIREARALAFYALALVFATGGYSRADFRRFAATYVAGTVAAVAAVFAHVQGHVPLPGYPDNIMTASYHLGTPGFLVEYLDWTVPIVAFALGLSGGLAARSRRVYVAAAISLLAIAWYALASAERFMQTVVAAVAVAVLALPSPPPRRLRIFYGVLAATALALVLVAGTRATTSPPWLGGPVATTMLRWNRLFDDDSLRFRIEEVIGGFPRFLSHPVFGEGLGGLVLADDPEHPGHPWPYIASSYGFFLVKTGLVGLLAYLSMAGTVLLEAWRQQRSHPQDQMWPTATVGVVVLGALLTLDLLHTSADTPEGAVSFSLIFGLIVSQAKRT